MDNEPFLIVALENLAFCYLGLLRPSLEGPETEVSILSRIPCHHEELGSHHEEYSLSSLLDLSTYYMSLSRIIRFYDILDEYMNSNKYSTATGPSRRCCNRSGPRWQGNRPVDLGQQREKFRRPLGQEYRILGRLHAYQRRQCYEEYVIIE
jgi:hypothetical protein